MICFRKYVQGLFPLLTTLAILSTRLDLFWRQVQGCDVTEPMRITSFLEGMRLVIFSALHRANEAYFDVSLRTFFS